MEEEREERRNAQVKYYIAYGSNLHVEQMRYRCPGAVPVGTAMLRNWKLVFRGSKTGSYLTIEPARGRRVPVAIWTVTEEDEAMLDVYEGCPKFYYKRRLMVPMDDMITGKRRMVTAFVYVMHRDRPRGVPSRRYIMTCLEGYEDFQFKMEPLVQAVQESWEASVRTKGG